MTRILLMFLSWFFVWSAHANTLTVVYPWQDSRPAINARILAKTMAKYLDVDRVEFRYMPGANGIVVANYVFSLPSNQSDYVVGTFNRNIPYVGVVGGKNVNFDSTRFSWIGSTDDGRYDNMILLSHKSYDGSIIVGSDTIDVANPVDFIQRSLGWNIHHVTGYRGNNALRLAFERKEIDAMLVNYNSIKYTRPAWLAENVVLFQFGNGKIKHPELPDTETLHNLISNKQELEQLELQYMIVRPFVASPNINPKSLDRLRKAFELAAHDDDYLNEARRQNLVVNFMDWQTTTKIVKRMKETL